MPAKKTTTSTATKSTSVSAGLSVTGSNSKSLELKKVIHQFSDVQKEFISCVLKLEGLQSGFEKFREDTIFSLDAEISDRMRQLEELGADFDNQRKRANIEIANDILRDKHKAASDFLALHDQVPINNSELQTLRSIKEDLEKEMEKRVEKEKDRAKRAVSEALKNSQLAHKAELAELQAQVKQQEIQIQHMNNLLVQREKDVAKQIQLTKDVADAGRSAAIQQTIASGK